MDVGYFLFWILKSNKLYLFAISFLLAFFKTVGNGCQINHINFFYKVHLITVKAVKLTSAFILWRIYFCNDIMYWNPASAPKTRPKELGYRSICLNEFNVHIIIFYWNVVCNGKVPHHKNKHKAIQAWCTQ